MIICYLADAASIHTQRWAGHFAAQGHQVHVISFSRATVPGAIVHPLRPRGSRGSEGGNWQLLLGLPTIKSLLRKIGPDLLHSHYLTSYGLLGALSGFKPLVGTAWGSDILVTPRKSIIYRLLLKYTLARCQVVTSDSAFMGDEALRYGLRPARLKILPLGVNLADFNQTGRAWPDEPPFSLLSMRFLDANANVNCLLEALATVVTQIPAVQLVITHRGPELEALQRQVKRFDLGPWVDFRGMVAHRQVPRLLKQADLCFSLLSHDATSVTLLEAMACGAFPIASDIPANREWIDDGRNGYLVSPRDARALAGRIVAALQQPGLRQRAAQANRHIVAQKADWHKNMRTASQIYRQLIAASE
ncbi:MAG: glycosyltransferase family 4 protein [Anaerolineae bacterium]